MAQVFGKLTGSPGNWSLPVVKRGPLKLLASDSVGVKTLQNASAADRHLLFGIVPIRRIPFNEETHREVDSSEVLVGDEIVVTPTTVLLPAANLAALRVQRAREVAASLSQSPVEVTLSIGVRPINMDGDAKFLMKVADDRRAAGRWPGRKWIFADGSISTLSAADAGAVYTRAESFVEAVYDALIVHIEAISSLAAADNQQAIFDYDITSGWPSSSVE